MVRHATLALAVLSTLGLSSSPLHTMTAMALPSETALTLTTGLVFFLAATAARRSLIRQQ